MKTREYKGGYLEIVCCTACNWFSNPDYIPRGFPVINRGCCPKCASDVANARGRYIIKETKGFFSGKKREVIGFEKVIGVSVGGRLSDGNFIPDKDSVSAVVETKSFHAPWPSFTDKDGKKFDRTAGGPITDHKMDS